MSNTPTNLRMALTSLIHSSALSMRISGASYHTNPPPTDQFNALVSAHVTKAKGSVPWFATHLVTFKPITKCYGVGLVTQDEADARAALTEIEPIRLSLTVNDGDPWLDIYNKLWAFETLRDFFLKVLKSHHGRYFGFREPHTVSRYSPDLYEGTIGGSAELQMAVFFPETCKKTGLSTMLLREQREAKEKQEWLKAYEKRQIREQQEKEAKEREAKRKQEEADKSVEKAYAEMLTRKAKEKLNE